MRKNKPPDLNVRFKSKKDYEALKRASRIQDVSLNKFVSGHAVRAAYEVIAQAKSSNVIEPTSAA